MALEKPIETRFGVDAEYWNQSTITINLREGVVTVALDGFLNQEKRDGNANPLDTMPISLAIGDPAVPVRRRQRGNPEFLPEGEGDVVEKASVVPFLPIEVIRAIQSAIYVAMKSTTPEFDGARDV